MAPSTSNGDAPAGGPPGGAAGAAEERGRPATGLVVRYGAMSWVGEFACRTPADFDCGDAVVVQTERGIELGWHVSPCQLDFDRAAYALRVRSYADSSGPEFCRPRAGRVLRLATRQDIDEQNHLNAHIREDIAYCAERAVALGLDMKVVTAEHLLGGERIVFYFAAPTRVDFRQLVRELAGRYRTRIEMRQVGARDEARLVADFEVCGRECCCRNFLKKLRPVNMKMAKLQKSTLDPSKVSGRCGRLRCCLRYEHLGYEQLAARLPRLNTRVQTAAGPATVIEQQVLTQLVLVRTDDERLLTIPVEEITAFNLPPAPPRPPPPGRPPAEGTPTGDRRTETAPRGNGRRRPPWRERGPRPTADAPLSGPGAPPAAAPQSPGPAGGERAAPTPPADAPRPESGPEGARPEAPAGPQAGGSPPAGGAGPRERGPRRRRRRRRHPRRGDGPPAPGPAPDG